MPEALALGPTVTELAVSSLQMAETIASTFCAYPRRDGRLSRPRWFLVKHQVGITDVTVNGHPSEY